MKQILAASLRKNALADIRFSEAIASVVGPAVNEKNQSIARQWMNNQQKHLDA